MNGYKRPKTDTHIFMEMEEKYYDVKGDKLGNRQFIVLDPDGYMLRLFEDIGKLS